MTPEMIALGLLAVLFVYASAMALGYRTRLDKMLEELGHAQSDVGIWRAKAEQYYLDLINFKREVEQAGYTDHEIQRLRATNNRLAVQLEQVTDELDLLKEAIEEAGQTDLLVDFYKGLDDHRRM